MTVSRHADGVVKALLLPLAFFGGIVACSSTPEDTRTGTGDDQRQLNASAAMLDSNSVDAKVLDDHESSAHD